jgi:hypothetical protein
MYTLRIIEETRENENAPFEQVIENFGLGNAYSILKKGVTKEFDEIMKSMFPESEKTNVRALICAENDTVWFIENNEKNKTYSYFIMTESGKTFEKL